MTMVPSAIAGTLADVIPSLSTIPQVDYTSRDYGSLVNDLINLIPTYLPEWTDRSPGDFGIVLIELFSYMGDIINFYSDRIANEAFLATAQQRQSVLNLASLLDYTPYGNVSALVMLQFSVTAPCPTVLIPAGTQVQGDLTSTGATTFETTQDAYIWGDFTPTTQTATGTNLAGQQILLNQGPYYFNGGGANQTVTVGGATWTLAPGNNLAGQVATATMFTVVGSPLPNTIQFGDGVHGAKPANGVAITVTYQPAVPSAVYTANTMPPQPGGGVPAQHGVSTSGEVIGTSTGLPAQSYTLFQTPVVDGSVIITIDEGGGPATWNYFQRLVDAMSTELAYTLNTDANGVVTVSFGDGINGRVPIPGSTITAAYTIGGGAAGNVSANTLTNLVTALPNISNVVAVTNPAGASGGADAETLDHIRIHAPLSITAINRAVTLDDYAALVLNNPSVAKAAATSTAYSSVNIYIHPTGDFINPPSALNTAVANLTPSITNSAYTGYLDDKKMVGTSVQILAPQYNKLGAIQVGYVPVDVTVAIQVLPQYNQASVRANTIAAIYNLMLFSVVDFGYRVTVSSVYHNVQAVEGVDYCQVTVLSRHENTPLSVGDVVCNVYEIPQANNVTVTATGGI
jgi:hypothetical protein